MHTGQDGSEMKVLAQAQILETLKDKRDITLKYDGMTKQGSHLMETGTFYRWLDSPCSYFFRACVFMFYSIAMLSVSTSNRLLLYFNYYLFNNVFIFTHLLVPFPDAM